ncbi:hypothetical protein O6H91_Y429300 [Diphasiastrum complanatum]|nr:hypothetical protein O6H91_Y429300 [Diphasiastrum complanatum]
MSKISFISIPAIMVHAVPINAITALLSSPDKAKKKFNPFWSKIRSGRSCWLLFVALFGSLSMLKALTSWPRHDVSEACYPKFPGFQSYDEKRLRMEPQQQLIEDFHVSLPPHALNSNLTQAEKAFWRQPDSLKLYKPCLNPSEDYQKASTPIDVQQRQKFLIVVVSGGLNQQRHQIVDAVVIARILEAALLLPIMQVNAIWQDDSEFSDIFDSEHFKHTLRNDVKVVSSLPSTHIRTRPVEQSKTPLNANPQWFRSYCLKRLNRHGILLLRGLDSRLSKDLPSDLQKLRCKVAFHALKFAAPLQSLANKLVQRMWSQGPYLALHLRLEKDVWVRTGCLPGIGPKYDHESKLERIRNPHLLTGRSNMSSEERRLAGLCPLNAAEVVRLLKALGASEKTRIYIAGGEPFGGIKALEPLQKGFSHLYDKDNLARPGNLSHSEIRHLVLLLLTTYYV